MASGGWSQASSRSWDSIRTTPAISYRASGADLEVVQEQLGHATVKTTTIYAKVTKQDKLHAANALAKLFRDSQQNGNSVAGSPLRFPGNAGKGARTGATF